MARTAVAVATVAPVTPATALGTVPAALRDPLLAAFNEIATNFAAQEWEPSELNGGKLCETAYTVLRSHVDGKWAAKPSKPKDFKQSCLNLEQIPKAAFPQSVRVTTPRLLMALYEIRNNRGVGHVGGDVDANHMDATLVLSGAKWVMAEFDPHLPQRLDRRSDRGRGRPRGARGTHRMDHRGPTPRPGPGNVDEVTQTLLLLYGPAGWVPEADLVAAVEHSNPSVYRRDLLVVAHKSRLIEYDATGRRAHISPLGIDYVEKNLGKYLVA